MPPCLPERSKDDVGIVRIENDIDAAGVFVFVENFLEGLSAVGRAKDAALFVRTVRVPSDSDSQSLRALLDRIDEYAISAKDFSVRTPDLDDVFLALTGRTNAEVIAQ